MIHQTLPRHFYAEPDFYTRELERFYFRRWICAGRADQIPDAGDYFTRTIGDESLIIVRGGDDGVHALFNVCRHRGTRLIDGAEGHLAARIQCPYHAWTYDLEGRLLSASHMPPEFCKEDYPLHRAGCETWDGHIFLRFDRPSQHIVAQPFRAPDAGLKPCATTVTPALIHELGELPQRFAAYRMQDLRLARRIVYDVKANWKLIVLNYSECLHCPNLHPALNRVHHYLAADNVAPTATYCGGAMGFRDGVETASTDGKRRRDFLPGLDASQRTRVEYYSIYPNFLLTLHPDYMLTHTLWPRAHDRTEIVCEWHFHPDEMAKPDFHADDAIEFWDVTNRQDWWICEQSQAGISSRAYQPGPYSTREELLWSFDDIVRRAAEES